MPREVTALLRVPGKGRAPCASCGRRLHPPYQPPPMWEPGKDPHEGAQPRVPCPRMAPGPTVSVVLHVVEVDPALPPVLLQQVTLGAAEVDPAALRQAEGWWGRGAGTGSGPPPLPPRLRAPGPGRTSSQLRSSFTQNLARWKLLLSVRSGGEGSGSAPPWHGSTPTLPHHRSPRTVPSP